MTVYLDVGVVSQSTFSQTTQTGCCSLFRIPTYLPTCLYTYLLMDSDLHWKDHVRKYLSTHRL